MKFAIVELKYEEKKMFIVPIEWIQHSKPKPSVEISYLCYISSDLTEEPNFDAKCLKKYDGTSGRFKIFIRKLTDSMEAAIKFQKEKRIQTVPKKFREPANTDAELNAEEAKKKRNQKRIEKESKEKANKENSAHLAAILNTQLASSDFKNVIDDIMDDNSDVNDDSDSSGINDDSQVSSKSIERSPNLASSVRILKTNVEAAIEPQQRQIQTLCRQETSKSSTCIVKQKSEKVRNRLTPPERMVVFPKPQQITKEKKDDGEKQITNSSVPNTELKVRPSPLVSVTVSANTKQESQNLLLPQQGSLELSNKKTNTGNFVKKSHPVPSKTTIADISGGKVQIPTANKSKKSVNNILKGVVKKRKVDPTHSDVSSTLPSASITSAEVSGTSSYIITIDGPSVEHDEHDINKLAPPTTNIEDRSASTSNLHIINIDQIFKKSANLERENIELQKENQKLAARNIALQDALVAASNAVPQVFYEQKDGGRLYNDGIFLNQIQCKILDSIDKDRPYLNYLTTAVFGSETLQRSSVTGAICNRTKAPPKPALDPTRLKLIYDLMAARTKNSPEYTKFKINLIINKKIANLGPLVTDDVNEVNDIVDAIANGIDCDVSNSNQRTADDNIMSDETHMFNQKNMGNDYEFHLGDELNSEDQINANYIDDALNLADLTDLNDLY